MQHLLPPVTPNTLDSQSHPVVERRCPAFYTAAETSKMLRLDESTLHRHLRNGTFPGVKIGGRYVVPHAVLERLISDVLATGRCVDLAEWTERWQVESVQPPLAPLTPTGIVLPQLAVVKGEPARGPLPRTEPSLRDRYAALDNHHPGQSAALYRVRGEDRRCLHPPPTEEVRSDGRAVDRAGEGTAASVAGRGVGLGDPPHSRRHRVQGLRRSGRAVHLD
jgi:hypothetical protein